MNYVLLLALDAGECVQFIKGMDPCNHDIKNSRMVTFLKELPFTGQEVGIRWVTQLYSYTPVDLYLRILFFLTLLFYPKLYFL